MGFSFEGFSFACEFLMVDNDLNMILNQQALTGEPPEGPFVYENFIA